MFKMGCSMARKIIGPTGSASGNRDGAGGSGAAEQQAACFSLGGGGGQHGSKSSKENNSRAAHQDAAAGGGGGGAQQKSKSANSSELDDFSKLEEDPRIPLNVRQIFKITKSWKAIARTMSKTGTAMFLNLFEQNQDLFYLFDRFQHLKGRELHESMELREHAATVMSTLDTSINSLSDYDNFVSYLHSIGELHRKVPGFKREYFWKIEQPFMKAVKQTLDERCNETIEEIYKIAIKLIIETIADGYGQDKAGGELAGGGGGNMTSGDGDNEPRNGGSNSGNNKSGNDDKEAARNSTNSGGSTSKAAGSGGAKDDARNAAGKQHALKASDGGNSESSARQNCCNQNQARQINRQTNATQMSSSGTTSTSTSTTITTTIRSQRGEEDTNIYPNKSPVCPISRGTSNSTRLSNGAGAAATPGAGHDESTTPTIADCSERCSPFISEKNKNKQKTGQILNLNYEPNHGERSQLGSLISSTCKLLQTTSVLIEQRIEEEQAAQKDDSLQACELEKLIKWQNLLTNLTVGSPPPPQPLNATNKQDDDENENAVEATQSQRAAQPRQDKQEQKQTVRRSSSRSQEQESEQAASSSCKRRFNIKSAGQQSPARVSQPMLTPLLLPTGASDNPGTTTDMIKQFEENDEKSTTVDCRDDGTLAPKITSTASNRSISSMTSNGSSRGASSLETHTSLSRIVTTRDSSLEDERQAPKASSIHHYSHCCSKAATTATETTETTEPVLAADHTIRDLSSEEQISPERVVTDYDAATNVQKQQQLQRQKETEHRTTRDNDGDDLVDFIKLLHLINNLILASASLRPPPPSPHSSAAHCSRPGSSLLSQLPTNNNCTQVSV